MIKGKGERGSGLKGPQAKQMHTRNKWSRMSKGQKPLFISSCHGTVFRFFQSLQFGISIFFLYTFYLRELTLCSKIWPACTCMIKSTQKYEEKGLRFIHRTMGTRGEAKPSQFINPDYFWSHLKYLENSSRATFLG